MVKRKSHKVSHKRSARKSIRHKSATKKHKPRKVSRSIKGSRGV